VAVARVWGALVVAALCAACVAQPVQAMKRVGGYRAQVFAGPPGSRSGFFSISDDGTAVGQQLLGDGSSHSILRSTHRTNGNPFAGRQTALIAIDAKDEAAGTLFGAGGATNPLFLTSDRRALTIPLNGSANAVAMGPLVAMTVIGSDGVEHAEITNPLTNSVRDLGPGRARGINTDGVVVGQTLTGNAAYWSKDGLLHDLGFPGSLLRVNLFMRAVGFSAQSGGPTPIALDLRNPSLITRLKLPSGFPFGSAKGLADNGLTVGTAYKNADGGLPSKGIAWVTPSKPLTIDFLVHGHIRKGLQVSDASGVDDNGLIAGAVTTPTGRARAANDAADEEPLVATPPIGPPRIKRSEKQYRFYFDKEDELRALVRALNQYSNGAAKTGELSTGIDNVKRGRESIVGPFDCSRALPRLTELFRAFTYTDENFTGEDLLNFRQDGLDAVAELTHELCD
jgi:hypothetical protein